MSFQQELHRDRVSSLRVREAIRIQTGTVLRAAIAQMRSKSLGVAVIVDFAGIPRGTFSEQSVIRVLKENVPLDSRAVREFADPVFCCVKQSDPIAVVWDAVQQQDFRYVCVTDDDGRLIGITGQRGLAEYVAECFAKVVTVQRLGSTPWMLQREGA
jgi:CBS domain-containing protein